MLADAGGNVIVVLSVPARVRLLLAVRVLPSAMVRVDPEAGAVIVTLLTDVADATPSVGVTSVGEVANTRAPVPVSSVTAAARLALDGVPRKVAMPAPKDVMPVPPLATAKVPPRVSVPVPVIGPPVSVSPVVPPDPLTEVTLPLPLLLKVVQSADDNAPRLLAEAVGTFSVITGVVVPVATVDDKSVPAVPSVIAATLVTVPEPLLLNVVQSALVR